MSTLTAAVPGIDVDAGPLVTPHLCLHVGPEPPTSSGGEAGVAPTEAELIAGRLDAGRAALRPVGAWQEWLCLQIVTASVRLDQCQAHAAQVRRYEAERAARLWDEDHRLAAENLGARLPRDPARVRLRLEQTRHGAEWLAERWADLAQRAEARASDRADAPAGWTEAERREALDLLGVPRAPRPAAPDAPARRPAAESCRRLDLPERPEGQAALARAHVARLAALRQSALDPLDERERLMAVQGQPARPSKPLVELQRQEARLRREQKAALDELRHLQAQGPVTRWVPLGKEHAPIPLHARPPADAPTPGTSPPSSTSQSAPASPPAAPASTVTARPARTSPPREHDGPVSPPPPLVVEHARGPAARPVAFAVAGPRDRRRGQAERSRPDA